MSHTKTELDQTENAFCDEQTCGLGIQNNHRAKHETNSVGAFWFRSSVIREKGQKVLPLS